jgi:hypothetical protein
MRINRNGLRVVLPVALAAALSAAVLVSAPAALAGASCPPPPSSGEPFAPWGDQNSYVPATDGGFEPIAKGSLQLPWSLSGSASISSDNEPWHTDGNKSDSHSLSIQTGGKAISACTTAPLVTSVVRFFIKNTGAASGELHVQLLVNGGKNGTLDGGYITASSDWHPTAVLALPWAHPLSGAVNLQVVLTPVGAGASFQIDDVYIDPRLVKLG